MQEELVIFQFKVTSWYLLRETEENRIIPIRSAGFRNRDLQRVSPELEAGSSVLSVENINFLIVDFECSKLPI